MQRFILILVAFLLTTFSLMAAADSRVVITGQPVTLEQRDNVYYYPAGTTAPTTTSDYYYYTFDGSNRVCYAQEKPAYTQLNAMVATVDFGGTTRTLHCYETNPTYFDVQ